MSFQPDWQYSAMAAPQAWPVVAEHSNYMFWAPPSHPASLAGGPPPSANLMQTGIDTTHDFAASASQPDLPHFPVNSSFGESSHANDNPIYSASEHGTTSRGSKDGKVATQVDTGTKKRKKKKHIPTKDLQSAANPTGVTFNNIIWSCPEEDCGAISHFGDVKALVRHGLRHIKFNGICPMCRTKIRTFSCYRRHKCSLNEENLPLQLELDARVRAELRNHEARLTAELMEERSYIKKSMQEDLKQSLTESDSEDQQPEKKQPKKKKSSKRQPSEKQPEKQQLEKRQPSERQPSKQHSSEQQPSEEQPGKQQPSRSRKRKRTPERAVSPAQAPTQVQENTDDSTVVAPNPESWVNTILAPAEIKMQQELLERLCLGPQMWIDSDEIWDSLEG